MASLHIGRHARFVRCAVVGRLWRSGINHAMGDFGIGDFVFSLNER